MSDISKALEAIRRPLEYAASSPQAAQRVRNLDVLIARQARELRRRGVDPEVQLALNELTSSLVGLEKLDQDERMLRLRRALRILDRLSPSAPAIQAAPEPVLVKPQPKPAPQSAAALDESIQFVKGVGPKVAQLLARRGIETVGQMLMLLPRAFDDRRLITAVEQLEPGERATLVLNVLEAMPKMRARGRPMYKVRAGDDSGELTLAWFNVPAYIPQVVRPGIRLVVTGEATQFRGGLEIHHPDIEPIDEQTEVGPSLHYGRIVPIYSEIEGLSKKRLRRILDSALDKVRGKVPDPLPLRLRERLGLLDLGLAIEQAHFPPEDEDPEKLRRMATAAYRRLIFDELFSLGLGLALSKRDLQRRPGIAFKIKTPSPSRLLEQQPFVLTAAQRRVLEEIQGDLRKPVPMNRLIQGDVGSGKTILAALAALSVIDNGYQAALMAPTELLAEQHAKRLSAQLAQLGLRAALLTGSVRGPERKRILSELRGGLIHLLIGTHALISQGVEFKRLGLVIVDEQHRFGVGQRAALSGKGTLPDVLIMTATPIPRTLALTLYGDLDISLLDEMPPGRTPIKTELVTKRGRAKLYRRIRAEVKAGHQVYLVYPLVEAAEDSDLADATASCEQLERKELKGLRLGLLHGRMKPAKKESVMRSFVAGKVDVLVSTTVIEVGIDVPNATLIVIEHAERFGLTQLHQLRGRVGRGEQPSSCLLVVGGAPGENAEQRLRVMVETTDGFRISEEDLALRGPGQFLGTRQSGLPDLRVANLARDVKLLSLARDEALRLVREDPQLAAAENRPLARLVKQRWGEGLGLGSIG
ncbi:MAG: ATP-dependent DNA helicase RecG [Candidatus Alcyoniella australis]|nr:ATP-dependent DNA helicase RecG [Candidatus Alcyoniella australis]